MGLEEAELVRRVLREAGLRQGTLIDVGAHFGTVTALFEPHGWTVFAFEPDVNNRMRFREKFDGAPSVTIDPRAVGEIDGEIVPLYVSPVSTGISGLVPFHYSHVVATEVSTVRLDTYFDDEGIDNADFLKIDTEGFDLFVLRSFPWSLCAPSAVLCEFEDAKTKEVGYTTEELAEYLIERGYTVLVSEWHPISRYGVVHSWRRMFRWGEQSTSLGEAWGNLIAFADPTCVDRALKLLPALLTPRGTVNSTVRARLAMMRVFPVSLRRQSQRTGRRDDDFDSVAAPTDR